MTMARNITFPDDLYKKLQTIAVESGVSVASIIKLACSNYIAEYEAKLKARTNFLDSDGNIPRDKSIWETINSPKTRQR